MLPIPVPATLECLKGIPIQQVDEPHELLTPTAACLLAEWVESFQPISISGMDRIGYGVGTRHLHSRPNVVRAVLCESSEGFESDRVVKIETQIDDSTGQQLGYVMELLFSAHALDVFFTPVQMKKNRPGVLITVLCPRKDSEKIAEILFQKTSTFGLRVSEVNRWKLKDRFVTQRVNGKKIQFREGWLKGKKIKSVPEFDQIKNINSI